MAYRELRTPVWPDTLQATLAHPTFGKCLRQAAMHRRRASPCVPQRVPMGAASIVPPTPTEPPARPHRPGRGYGTPTFDARKAAANDHDTD